VRRELPFIVVAALALVAATVGARADNAGFAIAPKDAVLAIDARDLSELLEGDRGELMRPILESFAGDEAMATFGLLAKRANAPGEKVARDLFSGRIAFWMAESDADAGWLIGFESDDQSCEHLLKMVRARMIVPGRFESPTEHLAMRRVGGWLLVAPLGERGFARIDAAAARVPVEDATISLLGEPLMQTLLASDAPLRMFVRHGAPTGGGTTLAIRGEKRGFRVEVSGGYDAPPLGLAYGTESLDRQLARAFEDRAVLFLANPADGVPTRADGFWLSLVPELRPPPAMRANLSGERVLIVGRSETRPMPAIACAWRVEDPDQAVGDQDHLMRGVCCGITRSLEDRTGSDQPAVVPALPLQLEARRFQLLGAFLDRYLGQPFKMGESTLCWRTVSTPCGGWQVYSSDPLWLVAVSERLGASSCGEEERPRASGIGFCDGPRAAALIRAWEPLVDPNGQGRLARGLASVSDMFERLGRIRFQYDMPAPQHLRATLEIEAPARLRESPERPRPLPVGTRP
jgi:hypothetical protein